MIRVYWKGKIQSADKVRISPVNTGLFYGESLFEAIPVYHGVPFELKEHLARLKKGCDFLNWPMPKAADFQKAVRLFHAELKGDFIIRFNLTQETKDKPGPRRFESHAPTLYATSRVLLHDIHGSEPPHGVVGLGAWQAAGAEVFPNYFKSAVYMTTRKMFREHPEWADILRLDEKGYVVDGGSSTPLWFDGRKVCAAPLGLGGLASVTRLKVLYLCNEMGIPVVEKRWKPEDALKKGEVLMVGSGVGVLGVTHIQGKKLKSKGIVTQLLWDAYRVEVLTMGNSHFD
jgi:branched-subunit amino acid aminotransferase/4-amino-4-deoxychorismate lyase